MALITLLQSKSSIITKDFYMCGACNVAENRIWSFPSWNKFSDQKLIGIKLASESFVSLEKQIDRATWPHGGAVCIFSAYFMLFFIRYVSASRMYMKLPLMSATMMTWRTAGRTNQFSCSKYVFSPILNVYLPRVVYFLVKAVVWLIAGVLL